MEFMLLPMLEAAVIAFVVTAVLGKPIILKLRQMKMGQKILEIGPKWHMNKQNIPTMGGFMFIFGIAAAVLVLAALFGVFGTDENAGMRSLRYFLVALMALAFGFVGCVDDYAKIKKKQNAGLTPMQKLLLQVVVAGIFIILLRIAGGLTVLSDGKIFVPVIPGTQVGFALPWQVYIVFAIVVIVGADNAVNLTDGIDGLAASVTIPVMLFFGLTSISLGTSVFAGAVAGGLFGFLLYNFHPAKVFMGDTGSLFLGGAVAGLAFACNMPFVLLPIGIVYIWETLSVIIQVTYFKISHGKRVFKMAPFHHHLELCGWGEKKIVAVFTAITVLMCVIAGIGYFSMI